MRIIHKAFIREVLQDYNREDLTFVLGTRYTNDPAVRTVLDSILISRDPVDTALLIKDLDALVGDGFASLTHRHHHFNTRHDTISKLCHVLHKWFD